MTVEEAQAKLEWVCGSSRTPARGALWDEAIEALVAAVRAESDVDIQAYRGALGYPVPGGYGDRLRDGTLPKNGIAEALHQQLAARGTGDIDARVLKVLSDDYQMIARLAADRLQSLDAYLKDVKR